MPQHSIDTDIVQFAELNPRRLASPLDIYTYQICQEIVNGELDDFNTLAEVQEAATNRLSLITKNRRFNQISRKIDDDIYVVAMMPTLGNDKFAQHKFRLCKQVALGQNPQFKTSQDIELHCFNTIELEEHLELIGDVKLRPEVASGLAQRCSAMTILYDDIMQVSKGKDNRISITLLNNDRESIPESVLRNYGRFSPSN